MAINKVVYGANTLLDLTGDTVTPDDVAEGVTFHDAAGVKRSGARSSMPTAHASTHATGGSDPITPASIGAAFTPVATTAELIAAGWVEDINNEIYTQTVSVMEVSASCNVIVTAAPASIIDATAAGVICTAQAAGELTFTCTVLPEGNIVMNVLVLE